MESRKPSNQGQSLHLGSSLSTTNTLSETIHFQASNANHKRDALEAPYQHTSSSTQLDAHLLSTEKNELTGLSQASRWGVEGLSGTSEAVAMLRDETQSRGILITSFIHIISFIFYCIKYYWHACFKGRMVWSARVSTEGAEASVAVHCVVCIHWWQTLSTINENLRYFSKKLFTFKCYSLTKLSL